MKTSHMQTCRIEISRRALGAAALLPLGAALSACRSGPDPRAEAATPAVPSSSSGPTASPTGRAPTARALATLEQTRARFAGAHAPRYWGLGAPGTISRVPSATQALCLTFDACGGRALKYDFALIELLRREKVPATLFLNLQWMKQHRLLTQQLIDDPLFEIANHGDRHVPLSVTGRSAYGITGTTDLDEVWREVTAAAAHLSDQFRQMPAFMRPGTAFSDETAAAAAKFIGQPVAAFSVNGDAGATLPAAQVSAQISRARAGDIVLCHMNHPGSGTAAGVEEALPRLRAAGLRFSTLSEALRHSA